MKISEIQHHLISESASIRDALEKINNLLISQFLVLFLINDKNEVVGSLTDGDIRRGLLRGLSLQDKVKLVANQNYNFLTRKSSVQEVRSFREEDLKIVPLLNEEKQIIDLINFRKTKSIIPADVVVMAGGKGTRLHPYTKDIPKPMLELKNKPIIAHNIDRLIFFGVKNFHISVNHLKDQIINFLRDYYANKEVTINFIEESQPLGTLGSVGLVDGYKNNHILVLNADILTNIDFEDFFLSHQANGSDMSVASFSIKTDIPYAVLETDGDRITSFAEKPSYTHYSNAGIYLFDKDSAKKIPANCHYDAIDLMSDLISSGKKVGHFPIRGYWLDIGNLQNYKKAQEDIWHIKFD